ncbi:hypothetical protein EPNKCIFM_00220 [Klebsiella phage KP13-16]|nr:hypothetical protein EPNKCIFM_00220 [Klebsiella phage KP13-16]
MTTIATRNGVMVSDGQVSWGDRIDQTNLKKVRKINGCLVGGAGRLSSVLQFFKWFEEWSDAQVVQGESPHVQVFIPENIDDEDFTGIVVFTDGVIFMYEGGKRCYEIVGAEYYAIGSGADFALSAMDAGASAEDAVKVAIKRDVFTGGELFIEHLDEEPEELTKEKAEEMTKEELVKYIFGEEPVNEDVKSEILDKEDDDDQIIAETATLALFKDGFLQVFSSDGETLKGECLNIKIQGDAKRCLEILSKKDILDNLQAFGVIAKEKSLKSDLKIKLHSKLVEIQEKHSDASKLPTVLSETDNS